MHQQNGGVADGGGEKITSSTCASQSPHCPESERHERPSHRFGEVAAKEDVVGEIGGVHEGNGRYQRRNFREMIPCQQIGRHPRKVEAEGECHAHGKVQILGKQPDERGDVGGERGVEIEERVAVSLRHVGSPSAVENALLQHVVKLGQAQQVEGGIVGAGEAGLQNRFQANEGEGENGQRWREAA